MGAPERWAVRAGDRYTGGRCDGRGRSGEGRESGRGDAVGGPVVPKMSVEVPGELPADPDEHVGEDAKLVDRGEAVRASIRKTPDRPDGIDARHGRLADEP